MPSGTARGLNRVPPQYIPEERPSAPRPKPKRGPIREALFMLGNGMDMPLFALVMVLLAIGLVMLFSASYADSYYRELGSYFYIQRQGMFAAAGVVAMLFLSTVNYKHYHRFTLWIAGGTVVLLVATLIFGVSEGVATRWLEIGPVQFQPSEIAKFAVVLLFADLIWRNANKMRTFSYGVVPFVLILGVFAGLVALENHMSGTLIILALGAFMMFLGGTRFRWFVLGGLAVAGLLLLYFTKGGGEEGEVYQLGRVQIWLDPFEYFESGDQTAWQTVQSLYAIGSGGMWGVGLGQSRQKYMYLPKPQNDFIFAIVCEELGLAGALVIMLLFALLIWRGVYVSLRVNDLFGCLLGLGLTFQVGLQVVLNICVVTNTIPNTGISLPFFSYGGTSLMMLLGEMGILLNISRHSGVEKT